MAYNLLQADPNAHADAARMLEDAASRIETLTASAARTLNTQCAEMAGTEPAARDWAAGYDQHAVAAFEALSAYVTAVRSTAWSLRSTAHGYAAAESANSGSGSEDPAFSYPGAVQACDGFELSSSYGGFEKPPEWLSLLDKYVVADLWPTGDVTKLHTAGETLNRLAADLDSVSASQIRSALRYFAGTNTPELPRIEATVNGHHDDLSSITTQLRTVAQSATAHGDNILNTREETGVQVTEMLAALVATEVIAAVLAGFTAGLSEVLAAGGDIAELAIYGARISAILEKFAAVTRSVFSFFDNSDFISDFASTVLKGGYRFAAKSVVSSAIVAGPYTVVDLGVHSVFQRDTFTEHLKFDLILGGVGTLVGGAVEEALGGFQSFQETGRAPAGETVVPESHAQHRLNAPESPGNTSGRPLAGRHRAPVTTGTLTAESKALVAKGLEDYKTGELIPERVSRFAAGAVTGLVTEQIVDPKGRPNFVHVLLDGLKDATHSGIFPENASTLGAGSVAAAH